LADVYSLSGFEVLASLSCRILDLPEKITIGVSKKITPHFCGAIVWLRCCGTYAQLPRLP
jgi:hypothetical protein